MSRRSRASAEFIALRALWEKKTPGQEVAGAYSCSTVKSLEMGRMKQRLASGVKGIRSQSFNDFGGLNSNPKANAGTRTTNENTMPAQTSRNFKSSRGGENGCVSTNSFSSIQVDRSDWFYQTEEPGVERGPRVTKIPRSVTTNYLPLHRQPKREEPNPVLPLRSDGQSRPRKDPDQGSQVPLQIINPNMKKWNTQPNLVRIQSPSDLGTEIPDECFRPDSLINSPIQLGQSLVKSVSFANTANLFGPTTPAKDKPRRPMINLKRRKNGSAEEERPESLGRQKSCPFFSRYTLGLNESATGVGRNEGIVHSMSQNRLPDIAEEVSPQARDCLEYRFGFLKPKTKRKSKGVGSQEYSLGGSNSIVDVSMPDISFSTTALDLSFMNSNLDLSLWGEEASARTKPASLFQRDFSGNPGQINRIGRFISVVQPNEQISEPQPSVYWAGRFSTLRDRCLDRILQGSLDGRLEMTGKESPFGGSSGLDEKIATHIFKILENQCTTSGAIESLLSFERWMEGDYNEDGAEADKCSRSTSKRGRYSTSIGGVLSVGSSRSRKDSKLFSAKPSKLSTSKFPSASHLVERLIGRLRDEKRERT